MIVGLIWTIILCVLGLACSAVILGTKYPRMTTDDFMALIFSFAIPIITFSILFWIECSTPTQVKFKKMICWAIFASVAWAGFILLPPGMAAAAYLGMSVWYFILSIFLLFIISVPAKFLARQCSKLLRVLSEFEIYKCMQFFVIAAIFVLQMFYW